MKKSGVFGHFSVYVKDLLKDHGMHSFPIAQFRVSRFNILFSNAAGIFFCMKNYIIPGAVWSRKQVDPVCAK